MKETIVEKYEKETGDSSIRYEAGNGIISFSEEYVQWLENQLEKQAKEIEELKGRSQFDFTLSLNDLQNFIRFAGREKNETNLNNKKGLIRFQYLNKLIDKITRMLKTLEK